MRINGGSVLQIEIWLEWTLNIWSKSSPKDGYQSSLQFLRVKIARVSLWFIGRDRLSALAYCGPLGKNVDFAAKGMPHVWPVWHCSWGSEGHFLIHTLVMCFFRCCMARCTRPFHRRKHHPFWFQLFCYFFVSSVTEDTFRIWGRWKLRRMWSCRLQGSSLGSIVSSFPIIFLNLNITCHWHVTHFSSLLLDSPNLISSHSHSLRLPLTHFIFDIPPIARISNFALPFIVGFVGLSC